MHTRLVRAVLAAALLAPAAVPAQQPVVITGRVLNATTSQPIAGAIVRVAEPAATVRARADGTYRLTLPAAPGLRGKEVSVWAGMIGYTSVTRPLVLTADSLALDFRLSASVLSLQGVVVTGQQTGRVMTRAINSVPATAARDRERVAGGMRRGARDGSTEEYAKIEENSFLSPRHDPLSTFSIDVDPASYANVRRFLAGGQLPPPDAVRIEEMVNYFRYDYPQSDGGHPFTVAAEVGPCPWNDAHRLVRIGLRARDVPLDRLPPSNLVFLVDVSGSMMSEDKLPLVKSALRMLTERLRPQDRVALVAYAGNAGLVLPSTPGTERARILAAIDGLEAGGSTAGGEGIRLAYDVARQGFVRGGNNRVILATDGDFNVGVSSTGDLVRLVEQRRDEGTALTVLGFGMGNLKDSRMEQLADHGNGGYAYIDSQREAQRVLVGQMAGTLFTLARDVKLQVEFNPARVGGYRLIGYENRLLADEDFNDDRKDAGDLGAGQTVTALYEVTPAGVGDPALRPVEALRYQRSLMRPESARRPELMTVAIRYKQPNGSRSRRFELPVVDAGAELAATTPDFRFAAAVAEFGMLLRGSEHRGSASAGGVLSLGAGAAGTDPEGLRAEFLNLVRNYANLAPQQQAAAK